MSVAPKMRIMRFIAMLFHHLLRNMLKTSLLFLLVLTHFSCGGSPQDSYKSFRTWAKEYLPDVENPDQYYQVWLKNADYVKKHNSQNYGYKLKLNQFAHLVSHISLTKSIYIQTISQYRSITVLLDVCMTLISKVHHLNLT